MVCLQVHLVADDRLELPILGYEPNVLPLHQSTIMRNSTFYNFTSVWQESIVTESKQTESTQVVSVGVEVVSFEQEAKVTRAAIINRFFMFFINIYFLIFSTWDGNRTRTDITVYWILSPARLPIPPPKQF